MNLAFCLMPPQNLHCCSSTLLAPRERCLLKTPLCHNTDKPRVAIRHCCPEVTDRCRKPPNSVPLGLSGSCQSQGPNATRQTDVKGLMCSTRSTAHKTNARPTTCYTLHSPTYPSVCMHTHTHALSLKQTHYVI